MLAILQTNVPDFIESSSDLNLVGYSVWNALQQVVYHQKFKNIDHLQQVLNSCWVMISDKLMNGAIGQWSKRLLLVIIHMVDRLNVVSVNSVICAFFKLFPS